MYQIWRRVGGKSDEENVLPKNLNGRKPIHGVVGVAYTD